MVKKAIAEQKTPAKTVEQAVEKAVEKKVEQSEPPPERSISFDEFELRRLSFVWREQKKGAQDMFFANYSYEEPFNPNSKSSEHLIFTTDVISLEKGGIPMMNPDFYPTPNCAKRAHFFIPKLETDPASLALFEKVFDPIDNLLDQEINVKKNANGFLSKKVDGKPVPIKGLKYEKIVRLSQPTKDDAEPYTRAKIRLWTEYDEEKQQDEDAVIKTTVFINNKEDCENTPTITDVEKYFFWQCKARFAIHLAKIWINAKKECSVGFICRQIDVTELSKKSRTSTVSNKKSIFVRMTKPVETVPPPEDPTPIKKEPLSAKKKEVPSKKKEEPKEEEVEASEEEEEIEVEEEEEEEEIEEEDLDPEPEPEPEPKSKRKTGRK